MKYIMTYESIEDFGPLSEQHFPAHLALIQEFHQRGDLLLMGPLQEPFNGDALAVFVSEQAANEFVTGDPFVVHGLVKTWKIRPWNEVLLPEPAV